MKLCYTIQVERQPAITLHQGSRREGKRFRVTYGGQQLLMLSYDEAAKALGEAVMHALARNCQIDNGENVP